MPNTKIIDFLIITALEEELNAILNKLPKYEMLPPSSEDVRIYYCSKLPTIFPDGTHGEYEVVVTVLPSMGRVAAAAVTSDAIRMWSPRYILLIGIAGGVSEQGAKLGDILVSTQIVDYELQKITPDRIEIRWQVHQSDPRLVTVTSVLDFEACVSYIKFLRPRHGKSKRILGPLASGDKVIAFGQVMSEYRNIWPSLIGVEMEAGGVAAISFQASRPPGFLMIRGVSDLADEKKNSKYVKRWRLYACDVAASYALAMLSRGPVPLQEIFEADKSAKKKT